MRILVTGAYGFIGSHIASTLHAAGHEIIAGVRRPDRHGRFAHWRSIQCDFACETHMEDWLPRLQGVDAVVVVVDSDRRDCKAFLQEFQALKIKMECRLIAFVLMLDHFHFVINPRDGNIREWTGALKSLTAKSLVKICPENWFVKANGEHQVWQESFKALPLWSNWMIWQKINYIHSNPLRAGLVKSTIDYRWSSFHSFYKEETEPLLQVDKEWSWPDDVQKLAKAMDQWEKEIERKGSKSGGKAALPDLQTDLD